MPDSDRPNEIKRRRARPASRRVGRPPAQRPSEIQESLCDLLQRVRSALSTVQIYGLILSSDRDGVVYLDGAVRTDDAYHDAQRLARLTPGVQKVVNRLSVDPLVGSMPIERTVTSAELAAEIELNNTSFARSTEDSLNELIGTTDTAISTDEAEPFFAPTDPVIDRAPREVGGYTVVGGFSPTSLDAPIELEQLPRPLRTSDDEIARKVRLALKEDAATADLPIYVAVRGGIVHLRGIVPSLAESDLVEEVAWRVPEVLDVRDEMEVVGV